MERKLGINTDCLRGLLDDLSTLELAHKIGFEAFTTGNADPANVAALKAKADELGMEFAFLHAPYKGINALWEESEETEVMMNKITSAIDAASACGVPAVILHVSSGWNPPPVTDRGLARYDALVDYAAQRGVIIALENLRCVGNLAYLMDRYEHRDNVRFCFDCGHEHCYTKTVSWQDIFTDKLIATHIHDNMGRPFEDKVTDRDTHWLPLDGTYNYHEMMRKFDKYGYRGPLVMEVFRTMRPDYREMTAETFVGTAYERLKRVSVM